jgi:starch-binding outer membrane protein SusE/F
MKNISRLLFASLLLVTGFSACEKDENKVFFEGGTAPVLTASTTAPMVLLIGDRNNEAIRFNWTNPDYRFTTGISSQDVTYTLQFDTTGSNFTNPKKFEKAISRDLAVTMTVGELNAAILGAELLENIPHDVEIRVKSSLANGSVPMYSNVIKIKITPFLDVAVPIPPTGELYITGDGTPSGWTNAPPVAQKATKLSNTEYTITMNFTPGLFYKFLSTQNAWQPQYGGPSATGGDFAANMGLPGQSDPPAIPTPATAGSYKVTLNFKTGKYTVVKL